MKERKKSKIKFDDLTQEEKDNLVNVFTWLIKEDRKQNPHLYKRPSKIGWQMVAKGGNSTQD